ncbi:MAG TPA: TetR/AcrR family transcriptional regulator [Ramlibacter sp.]|nr:TetR/AcrR family transcriptional regulator [Ramlibacter sp.]
MKQKKVRSPVPPRERILEAAALMFYEDGIRGVGVEAIAAAADTTKMAIYRNFDSKDELVAEWVRGLTLQYSAVLDDLEARHPGDARAQLLGFVDFIVDSLYKVSHRGCPFVNSISDLPDRNHPARQLIETHKARQASRLARLCEEAGIPQPREAAVELTFLLEGAQITALNRGVAGVDSMLAVLAHRVIDRGLPKRRGSPKGGPLPAPAQRAGNAKAR